MTLKRCGRYWFHCWHFLKDTKVPWNKGCVAKPEQDAITQQCCRCEKQRTFSYSLSSDEGGY